MQTASLHKFVKGGGGLIGVKHNCRLDNFRAVEHALEKKDKASGTVLERYPTGTFVAFDITVEDAGVDPEFSQSTQYLRLGRVPAWRTGQLGEVVDADRQKFPGGVLPSADGENAATAGPFVVVDGESGIWEGEEWPMFETELHNLANAAGAEDQYLGGLDAKGLASLNGIRVFLDQKVKPKGKKAQADPNSKDKSVIVPTKVNAWPWQVTGHATPVAAPAPVAKPVPAAAQAAAQAAPINVTATPVAAPAAATPVATPAAGANGSHDYDALSIEWAKRAATSAGGMLKRADVVTTVFKLTAAPGSGLDGQDRMAVMQRLNNATFIPKAAEAGHFMYDPSTDTMMVVG